MYKLIKLFVFFPVKFFNASNTACSRNFAFPVLWGKKGVRIYSRRSQ